MSRWAGAKTLTQIWSAPNSYRTLTELRRECIPSATPRGGALHTDSLRSGAGGVSVPRRRPRYFLRLI